ncbi:MAG: SDR family oxidoreductase [Proteobacteria bacterium]|nr:SDR family oxidoreductase [Pseudomonadota bacterium]
MHNKNRVGTKQTALITGASSGIGRELAGYFAQDGYNLVLVARSEIALQDLARCLSDKYGISAAAIPCDLSTLDGITVLLAEISRRNLEIDVLVNDAGYGVASAVKTIDPQAQLNMIDLNVRALTELTRAVWPGMLARRRGGLLNVASMAALTPSPFMAAYGATKAYVLSFSEALWEEARGSGVRVTCLCPGATDTKFHQRAGTENMPAGKAPRMSARKTAQLGYRAFRANKRVEIPGLGNKLIARVMSFIPTGALLKTIGRVYQV